MDVYDLFIYDYNVLLLRLNMYWNQKLKISSE